MDKISTQNCSIKIKRLTENEIKLIQQKYKVQPEADQVMINFCTNGIQLLSSACF